MKQHFVLTGPSLSLHKSCRPPSSWLPPLGQGSQQGRLQTSRRPPPPTAFSGSGLISGGTPQRRLGGLLFWCACMGVCVCPCAGGGQRQKADLKCMLSPRGIWKVTNLLAFWDGTVCVCVCACARAHSCACHCTCTWMCGSRCACKGVHERIGDCMHTDHTQDGRCVDVCVPVCGVEEPQGTDSLGI